MQEAQSIIIGISSGTGGALAAVTAFMIAFRSLEKSVESATKRIRQVEDRLSEEVKAIDTCLSRKIDQTASTLAEVNTTLQTLLLRATNMEHTISRVTRVEIRRPGEPEQH